MIVIEKIKYITNIKINLIKSSDRICLKLKAGGG